MLYVLKYSQAVALRKDSLLPQAEIWKNHQHARLLCYKSDGILSQKIDKIMELFFKTLQKKATS